MHKGGLPTQWNPVEPNGTLWNPMEPYGTQWNPMEPYDPGSTECSVGRNSSEQPVEEPDVSHWAEIGAIGP
jgi:hypothetical protein